MYHEMHCLLILKHILEEENGLGAEHAEHCLNYLRQHIICEGDMTVESREGDGSDEGWRICKDFKVVHEFAERNHRDWVNFRESLHGVE